MQAAAIDTKIAAACARHPRRFEVPATADFFEKVTRALSLVREELPACCRRHASEWTERIGA